MKRLLLTAGLLAFALFAYKNYNFVKKLEWNITNVRAEVGVLNSKVILDVALTNNTDTIVNLNSIVGVISFNGQIVGNVNYNTNLIIDAGKTTILTIAADINNINVFNQLLLFINYKNAIVNFKGTVNAQGLIIPINYDYDLKNG
jgi:hypothetical protein